MFSNAIIPWILVALVITLCVVAILTARYWEQSRRSRFFFQRREATQKLQNYTLVNIVLIVTILVISVYGLSPSKKGNSLVKVISSGKPVGVQVAQRSKDRQVVEASPEPTSTSVQTQARLLPPPFKPTAVPELPPEYREIAPSAEFDEAMTFKKIVFSQKIDSRKRPVNPSDQFPEGQYTLYATFDYANLENGVSWAWVLRRDGKIISGNEATWDLGYGGPGYIYFTPLEGFSEGVYTLEMWLNGKLVSEAPINIYSNVAR